MNTFLNRALNIYNSSKIYQNLLHLKIHGLKNNPSIILWNYYYTIVSFHTAEAYCGIKCWGQLIGLLISAPAILKHSGSPRHLIKLVL